MKCKSTSDLGRVLRRLQNVLTNVILLSFFALFFSTNLFAQTDDPLSSEWLSPDVQNLDFIQAGKSMPSSITARTAPASDINPDIPQTLLCSNLKVVFVLDESGSINSTEANSVREGARALANALLNSGASLQLVEFNTTSSIINLGGTTVNSSLVSNLNSYLGTGYGGLNYNPTSSGSCVGWTNWEDALDDVATLDADLVIFFTDGNPTAYNVASGGSCNSGTVVSGVTNGESLYQAIEKANAVKAQGKHMFLVGVGTDAEINLDNIRAISGSDLFGASNNVLTADYTRPPYSQLASDIQAAVNAICGTSLLISKTSSQAGVCANQFVELTTTVTNTGGDYNFDANNVVISDVYPNGYSNLSIVSPATGATISGSTVTYNVGNMVSGETATLVVRAKVLAPVRIYNNVVTATSFNANTVKDSVSVIAGISTSQIDTAYCSSITVNQEEYTTSGTYTQTFPNASAAGCDSVLTINFTLLEPTSSIETLYACGSLEWHGTVYTESNNTATFITTNAAGCDSTITINLTITPITENVTTISNCDSYTWPVNGTNYTQSGTYSSTSNCNTEILNLTITPSSSNETSVSVCDSYTWPVNGTNYTQSGTYTSISNCRTEILNLTITASSSNVTPVSVCDSYTWPVNGTNYTQSGTYTSISNCHSEILNLTITPSSSNATSVSVCDSYTWPVNGTNYTQSGTYTSLSNCRTETLNLTIIASSSNVTPVSVCDSYTWPVNGTNYTQSGTYTSISNCRTEILNLTITPSSKTITTASACGTYHWSATNSDYTTSGKYALVTGCHTDSLYLTVTYNTTSDSTASVCNSFTWRGTTYTTSGDKTFVSQSGAGCTNTATLHLTIRTAPVAGSISGPTLVCKSKTGIVYSIPEAAGATSYTWTLPTGMTGTSTTNSITVATGTTFCNGIIKVTANNNCGSSTASQLSLTAISAVPATPTTITGSTSFCTAGVYTYTVGAVANATDYTWTVTGSGLSITSGQNTATITVTATTAFTSGTISVKASNCFGVSCSAKSITVTKSASAAKPSAITGPVTNVCKGANLVYSVTAVAGVTYAWTVPTGATITSGAGTNSIKVTYGATFVGTGSIGVTATNGCGTSAASTLAVSALLGQPGAITGSTGCTRSQSSVTFSITAITGATSYAWTITGGATFVGATTGTSVKVNFATATSSSITISVKAVNACGSSAASTKVVTVNLTARSGAEAIAPTTIETISEAGIYPNPSRGNFNLNFNTKNSDKVMVSIMDASGRVVYKSVKTYAEGNQLNMIDVSGLKKGLYFLHLVRNNKEEKTLPVSIL